MSFAAVGPPVGACKMAEMTSQVLKVVKRGAALLGIYKEKQDPFSALPDELMIKIFSYLNPKDLVEVIPFVSTRFETLSGDPQVWRVLVFGERSRIESKRLLEIVGPRITMVRSVKIEDPWCRLPPDDILNALEASPCLESLHLIDIKVEKKDTLRRLVSSSRKLKSVTMTACNFSSMSQNPMDVFAKCSSLEVLRLAHNDGSFFGVNGNLERHWSNLKEVSFKPYFSSADTAFRVLADSAGQLRKLYIGDLKKPESYLHLAKFKKLEELYLVTSNISDDGLLNGIGDIAGLRKLTIHGSKSLSAPALCAYFSAPRVKANLQYLRLMYTTELNDDCLWAISRCTSLTNLILEECDNITIEGVLDLKVLRPDVVLKVKGCGYIQGMLEECGVPSYDEYDIREDIASGVSVLFLLAVVGAFWWITALF